VFLGEESDGNYSCVETFFSYSLFFFFSVYSSVTANELLESRRHCAISREREKMSPRNKAGKRLLMSWQRTHPQRKRRKRLTSRRLRRSSMKRNFSIGRERETNGKRKRGVRNRKWRCCPIRRLISRRVRSLRRVSWLSCRHFKRGCDRTRHSKNSRPSLWRSNRRPVSSIALCAL
jgi:hypothetical protein